jgi:hypothetical protein
LTEFEDLVEHAAIFHENYFICSSLPHLNIQELYSYLVGTTSQGAQNSQKQADSIPASQIAALFKCSQYKNPGTVRRYTDEEQKQEEPVDLQTNQSNFSRVSPQTASTDLTAVTQMISQFLIGPQFPPGPHKPTDSGFTEVYAPYVYIKNKAGKL